VSKPKATSVFCDGVCPRVIVCTECDGVEYSWENCYADKILGGYILFNGVESSENQMVLYLRNSEGKWISDVSRLGVTDDIAAHLDLVEEMAAAYRLNHFDAPQ
jgi:hypothetical protein